MTYISDATRAHQAVLAAKCVLLAIPYQYIRERVAGSLLPASFGPLKLNTLWGPLLSRGFATQREYTLQLMNLSVPRPGLGYVRRNESKKPVGESFCGP